MLDTVLRGFEEIFQHHLVISISGESGSGKTSLALFLVGQSLSNGDSCFWIQVSEPFPKNRLISMYQHKKEKFKFLLNNIYIAPNKVIPSYSEQYNLFENITSENFLFPPDLRFIVIDNISHHLRYEISKIDDIKKRTFILDDFYDNIISPLILRCQREDITLILIHEVSFHAKLQKTVPFFHSLYNRIKGVNIFLRKSLNSKRRLMEIEMGNKATSLHFRLDNQGFIFST
ncbi:MAG: hypothetical protein ACFE94_18860 [Candidatus Hodarchaeota archaeon]